MTNILGSTTWASREKVKTFESANEGVKVAEFSLTTFDGPYLRIPSRKCFYKRLIQLDDIALKAAPRFQKHDRLEN